MLRTKAQRSDNHTTPQQPLISPPQWASVALLLAFSVLLGACSNGPTEEQQARNDLGVAQMGRYEYETAHDTFAALVSEQPDWINARVNLGIATLNRQQEGDEKRAFDILAAVLEAHPDEPRALYTSGIIESFLGNSESAARFFARVTELDPTDAYAAYYLGQSYLQTESYELAASWLQRSLELDPYLRSGYWGAAQALRRLGQQEKARQLIADYQRFESNPAAHTAGFSYKKMGPKAEVISDIVRPVALPPSPQGALFNAAVTHPDIPDAPRGLAFADLNGDAHLDIHISAPKSAVLLSVDGSHVVAPGHPLSGIDSNATAFADADDDGDVDALICRSDDVLLYLQSDELQSDELQSDELQSDEGWQQATTLPTPCSAIAVFDADHDGDLDVLVTGDGGTELYNNNRDGTYRPIGRDIGFSNSLAGRQLLAVDLDDDRDLDLLVFGDDGTSQVWLNDRTWQYELQPPTPMNAIHVVAATAGDTNADGMIDLYLAELTPAESGASPAGANASIIRVMTFDPNGTHVIRELALLDTVVTELALVDMNGNGTEDLVATTREGAVVLRTDGTELTRLSADNVISARPFHEAQGPGMFLLTSSQLSHHAAGPGRYPYLSLELTGRTESDQMRSNASGVGTRIQVRSGGRWSVLDALDNHSGPGQSLMPAMIGLGGYPSADYIALTWSDGVSQTEIGLSPGKHRIEETQRQLASCPVIFTWDGERFRFASDVLGVGGLGFFSKPGVSAEPRPFERFLLPADGMALRDDRYLVKLTEPMEENAYLDQVTLEAVDVPTGWHITLDERMSTAEPHATGRLITWRNALVPNRVVDAAGNDVTSLVQEADQRAPEPGQVDSRFIGLLASEQQLTLTFDTPIQNASPVLVAEGWVEYPYSQTVFAAWQAGVSYRTATLEALDSEGRWVTVASEFGYPAGMPRTMALPLPELPEGTRNLRIRSNMEIYWDQIKVVYEESVTVQHHRHKPVVARINKVGFPRRTNGPQRLPHFDYHDRAPYWDTKYQEGYYTALGDALALVENTDGALAIFGGGEEIHLEFEAFNKPAPGMTRHLLLDFRGWAKDMDLYTADGETVGPIPVPTGLTPDELADARALNDLYNTRYQAGLR